ncbi:hypothetical protein HY491_04595 [Candidatus Woesearchaeota archaeon]|nr:hypothetical protein [Candidatus Woesearchaeota archaeon]
MSRSTVFAAAFVLLALVALFIRQEIEDNNLKQKDALLTWAYEHAKDHSSLQRSSEHPGGGPLTQHLDVILKEGNTVHFHRATVNDWGYIVGEHPWKYWRSYQSHELQEQALARIREARLASEQSPDTATREEKHGALQVMPGTFIEDLPFPTSMLSPIDFAAEIMLTNPKILFTDRQLNDPILEQMLADALNAPNEPAVHAAEQHILRYFMDQAQPKLKRVRR